MSCSGCIRTTRVVQSLFGKDRSYMGWTVNSDSWMTVGKPVNDIRNKHSLAKKPNGKKFCASGKLICRTADNSEQQQLPWPFPEQSCALCSGASSEHCFKASERRMQCSGLEPGALLGCSVISWWACEFIYLLLSVIMYLKAVSENIFKINQFQYHKNEH